MFTVYPPPRAICQQKKNHTRFVKFLFKCPFFCFGAVASGNLRGNIKINQELVY